MPKVIQAAEFFVVGGPVQPERLCYVERAADRQLLEAIRGERLACVLGPRAIGKSSLMHRTARTLRQTGGLTAVVDLVQIDARGAGASADSWMLAIAHRVVHELGIRIDLDGWWREKTALGADQRLVEFCWEVVLTNTTAPVTVFVDEVEAALGLPFADELFTAIHTCYARRALERDFNRLNFVLLGCTSRRELAGGDRASPFATTAVIEPQDFSLDEAYSLAVGLGGENDLAQALMDRICAWTGGQPYLTQKVARGVARKGGKLEDVERVVREQVLAPAAVAGEPLLGHVRAWLDARTPSARRAAKVLRKLVAAPAVRAPADPAVLDRLLLSGVVVLDAERRCRLRSRLYKELLAGPWRPRGALGWRLAAAAVVIAAVGAAGAYWYLERLPQVDIATLTNPSSDMAAVDVSYRRLRALPGFTERADGLWLAALERQSAAAATFADAMAVDGRVRSLTGQEATADRWLAAFWLRRTVAAVNAQQRDAAVLLAQRATQLPGATPAAPGWFAELVGDDYPLLERSLRRTGEVAAWHMQFDRATLATVDATRQLVHVPFGGLASGAPPAPLTALRHVALQRDLIVEGDGTAGEFELALGLQHPAAGELLVTLMAPSGAEASVVVPRGDGNAAETFVFPAVAGGALAALADEGRRGAWRLTIVDRRADNAGTLVSWALRFGADEWRDAPTEPLSIADPVRTAEVAVTMVGSHALVRPEPPGAIGSIAVWSLAAGRLENDFAVPAVPRDVAVNVLGDRLLAATDRVLTLFDVTEGLPIARLTTESGFVLPPVFSADGGYVAIAERVDGAPPLVSVLRANNASLVGSHEGIDGANGWQLGPGARYAVLQVPGGAAVRVVELRGRGEPRTLPHARTVERVIVPAEGTALLTVADGVVQSWNLAAAAAAPIVLGVTTAAASISVSADGARAAFGVAGGAVAVVDVTSGVELHRLGRGGAPAVDATQWSPDRAALVSASAASWRLWRLPTATAATSRARSVAAPTALALDRATDNVAVGLASGQLQLQRGVVPTAADLDFFGHRGAITVVALAGGRALAATGGNDGVVRLWDTAAVVPTGVVMQPAAAPITAVALSMDGQLVASGAGRSVRIARVADGVVTASVTLGADVTTLAFAPDASAIAAGDSRGTVTLTRLTTDGAAFTISVDAPVTALAFAPAGDRLAVGTAVGVRLLAAIDGSEFAASRPLPQAVAWLDFSSDGTSVLVASEDWWQALASTATLEPLATRFVPRGDAPQAWAAGVALAVRRASIGATGAIGLLALDLAAAPQSEVNTVPLLERDWATALALRLNDAGEPELLSP